MDSCCRPPGPGCYRVVDLSDFHPLIREVLRTGRTLSHEEVARATGKPVAEVTRLLSQPTNRETSTDSGAEESASEHPDAIQFRTKYHRLVAELSAAWLEENFTVDNRVPATELERIESMCNRRIQLEWRRHLKPPDEEFSDE